MTAQPDPEATTALRLRGVLFEKSARLTDAQLPLLHLDPYNWQTPLQPEAGQSQQEAAQDTSCTSPWCDTFDRLLQDVTAKFFAMWGPAYRISRGAGGWQGSPEAIRDDQGHLEASEKVRSIGQMTLFCG